MLSDSISMVISGMLDAYGPKLLTAPPAVSYAAPVAVVKSLEPEPYDPNPQFTFSYGVSDHSTGDSKSTEETLVNGSIRKIYKP